MLRRLRSVLKACLRRSRFESGMDDELRFHIEAYAADLMRSGVPEAEARRRARLEFGTVETIKEECRQSRGLRAIDEVRQDLRYAIRMIVKTPMFTAAAIVSLALGIGGNTAIFSLLDALLFEKLPVDRPDQLYFLAHDPGPNISTSSNYPLYERYRAVPSFSGITAYRGWTFRVAAPDGLRQAPGQFVSGNYHAVVGVPIVLGRGFLAEPDRGPASLIAVISDEYWTTHFARRPDVIGQPLIVDGHTLSIVGVTAPGFRGLSPGRRVDITVPMSVMALDTPEFLNDHGGWVGMVIVGRLAPHVRDTEALAAADLLFQRYLEEPENRWSRAVNPDAFRAAALTPAARGTWTLRDQYSRPLWISMAMVAVVLLIACANVANLLLARAAARSREVAVRLSLGASRGRLARQLLTESLLLACSGGAAGSLVAMWATGAILSFFSIGPSPVSIDTTLNVRVFAFTTAVVALTGLGFGLVPAFTSTRLDLAPTLKATAVTTHPGARRALGKSALAAQVALCVLMVSVATLLCRSLSRLEGFDAGFDRERILLADIDGAALDGADRFRVYADAIERLRRVPGVQAVALSSRTPIDFSSQSRRIDVPGAPQTGPIGSGVSTNLVTPEYFRTFGIAIIGGRGLTDADRQGTPHVAVVSESMATFYFKGSDPIGRSFILGGEKERTTIVGIVEDVRHEYLRVETTPRMVYTPLAQSGVALGGTLGPSRLTMALRSTDNPAAIAATVRGELQGLSNRVLIPYVRTMREQVDATLVPEHLLAALSTAFAAIAVLLACVGLYGVMSYNVARRTREIGIRIALGAVPRAVLYRVLRETVTIAGVGVAFGVSIALATTPMLSTFLFQLAPRDPATLIGTAALLLLVAAAAGFIPARHAASVDPVRALRND